MKQEVLKRELEKEFSMYLDAASRAWLISVNSTNMQRRSKAKYMAQRFMGKYDVLAKIMTKYFPR